jgi:Flp pilus assembly protein TadG
VSHRRRRSERGSALVEVTWLSLLLLVPLVYVLLSVFAVQSGSFAVSGAARAAARAFSLAPDEASARERARAAAAVVLADHDLGPGDSDVAVTCRPDPSNCLAPGSVITAVVRHQVVLPLVPSALGSQAPSFRVEAQSSVSYGTFREDR